MSLDPHWFSTLLGGYFFIGNLYIGVAFLAVVAVWTHAQVRWRGYVGTDQLHDVGKLLLGFCMLWTYLFWAQYLVIWYGDLPEETAFVMHRTAEAPWAVLAWIVVVRMFSDSLRDAAQPGGEATSPRLVDDCPRGARQYVARAVHARLAVAVDG